MNQVDEHLKKFGERIKLLRTRLKMTQKEFAEKLDITGSALSSYETGTSKPSLSVAIKAAEAFNISIDWLCGLSSEENLSENFENAADVLRAFVKIGDSVLLNIKQDKNGAFGTTVSTEDRAIQCFLSEWAAMYGLRRTGAIDKDLYSLWAEKQYGDYSMLVFPKEDTQEEISEYLALQDILLHEHGLN